MEGCTRRGFHLEEVVFQSKLRHGADSDDGIRKRQNDQIVQTGGVIQDSHRAITGSISTASTCPVSNAASRARSRAIVSTYVSRYFCGFEEVLSIIFLASRSSF